MSDLYSQLVSPAPTGVFYRSRYDDVHAHTPGLRCPAPACRWALPVYPASGETAADALREARQARRDAAEALERARRADVRMGRVLCLAAVAVAVAAMALVGVLTAFGGA